MGTPPPMDSGLLHVLLEIREDTGELRGSVGELASAQQTTRADLEALRRDVHDIRLVLRVSGLINGVAPDGSILPASRSPAMPGDAHAAEDDGGRLANEAIDPILGALIRRGAARYWKHAVATVGMLATAGGCATMDFGAARELVVRLLGSIVP